MRAATTHSSGTTLFTFTAPKCAITPIQGVDRPSSGRKISGFRSAAPESGSGRSPLRKAPLRKRRAAPLPEAVPEAGGSRRSRLRKPSGRVKIGCGAARSLEISGPATGCSVRCLISAKEESRPGTPAGTPVCRDVAEMPVSDQPYPKPSGWDNWGVGRWRPSK